MFKFLTQLFRKPAAPISAPTPRPKESQPLSIPLSQVETASLSLTAILERFPAELRKTIINVPGPDAMVALPLSTIVKQLPTGSVKMSLASIHRQAPTGTFSAAAAEEKRMVEVPLGEIFKRVKPDLLKRRPDQRTHELAEEGIDIFGDKENPHALAPSIAEEKPRVAVAPPPPVEEPLAPPPDFAPASTRTLKMPEPMISAAPRGMMPKSELAPDRVAPPETPSEQPAAASTPAEAPLVLPLRELLAAWPEPVRNEAASLDGATVSLPAADVSAGLAKGKVSFTWEQLRSWITPEVPGDTPHASVELALPLRVVAPAFLKASKQIKERKSRTVDESIPALFSGGAAAKPHPPSAPLAAVGPEPAAAAPCIAKPEPPPPPPVVHPDEPEPVRVTAVDHAAKAAATIGEVFGQPDKTTWSPAEIVEHTAKLPQIAGAIVALQEGLVVAHHLPEHMKGEVVAAFLPQIFGRLNRYSGEMKLGEVEDVLLCAEGAYFQAFRLGFVFFAVLGKPGESLPWQELRLIADELAQQTKQN